jgi:hypothetical protein
MKHLLTVDDLGPRPEIEKMLDLTDSFVEVQQREIPKVPALRGKTVVSLCVGCTAARRVVVLGGRHQRRRRAPRAPDAGAARRVHAAPPPWAVARRLPGRDRGRRQALARRAQRREDVPRARV